VEDNEPSDAVVHCVTIAISATIFVTEPNFVKDAMRERALAIYEIVGADFHRIETQREYVGHGEWAPNVEWRK
jgi:hypothetical protein